MYKAKNIAICLLLSIASMVASAATTTNVNCFVEYIQSSGTQWINTGVIGKSSVNIAADVTVLNCAGSSCFIGERPSTSDKVVKLGIWIGKDYKWALNCGGIDSSQVGDAFLNTRCVVSNENARLWVAPYGGASQRIYNGANQIFSSSLPLTMFFLNTDAGLDQGSNRPLSAKVYGLTIYDNGAIVRDFRPCQVTISDTDAGTEVTKYGLWDRVGSRFYGDESGGVDFTVGNVVANDPIVVIASDERGLQGVEAPGSYTVNDRQTFSANDVAVGPLVWSPIGYALEIWDSVNCKWSVLKMVKGSSYTYVRSAESGTVRLRWLWSQTGNVRHYGIGDYIHSQGLFAHFDGVYNAGLNAAHLTSPSTWANLANGGFNLTRKNDSSFNDDSWVGNKKSYFAANSIHAASALIAKSLTLEMMISSPTPPAKTYAVWAFFGNNANNRQLGVDIRSGDTSHPLVQGIQYRALGKWNSNAAVPNNDNPITKWDTRQYVAVVCDGSTASGYCNGMNLFHSITVPEGDATFDGNPTFDYFGIGAHNDGTSPALSGSQICAVRMTAGVLEDWQIEHNSAVDNARFASNIIVVNGEIGETGVKGTSSADGSYNLLSGTFTITASKEEVDRVSYAPQVTVEILENGVWNVAEENLFTQSYTIDKDVIGEKSVRITWTWESTFQAFAIHPIAEQSHDNGEKCCPQVVVTNAASGDTWIAGGDIESPYFDVEYTNNEGVGIANVTVIGKGEYAGLALKSTFVITATKLDDENLFVADPSVRRYEVDGAFVYVFTNAASQHVVTAKRNLVMLKYLLAGGGGGGGNSMGGGGGAGGVLIDDAVNGAFVTEGDTFTFTIGAGGNGSGSQDTKGSNGGATKLDFGSLSLSASGGGGGGSWRNNPGASGGSGGGGVQLGAGGTGISGQGFEGAAGLVSNGGESGGGGGAGHAGYTAGDGHAGYGGEGVSNNFTGAWVVYGGGGGAGGSSSGFGTNAAGLGGLGGGGNGGKSTAGEKGVDGLGGGGGGGGWNGSVKSGGKGGSGAVVLVLKPNDLTVVIEDQVWESFDPCCPEFVVSNTLTSATWVVGGDVASEYFDVEYSNNIGAGTGNILIIGKGEFSGVYHSAPFKISASKYIDENICTTDLLSRRYEVDGKFVYTFADSSAAQTVEVLRGINLVEYLIVGGGGGGGRGRAGGGGGGAVVKESSIANAYLAKGDVFTVVVGKGGDGSTLDSNCGINGGLSSLTFSSINAFAPGGGGAGSWSAINGKTGASGGGGCQEGAGGAGVDGFGFAGAAGSGKNTAASGGGGGAGHEGYAADTSSKVAGNGGEGVACAIIGEEKYYGGGGGGGGGHKSAWHGYAYNAGLGGIGGGGNGGKDTAGENGADGLGGGGGGGGLATGDVNQNGGNGGSGAVIVAIRVSDFEVDPISDQYFVSGGVEVLPVVRDGETILVKDTDYTVEYANTTQPGIATVTIVGINDYTGKSAVVSYKIISRYFAKPSIITGGDGRSWESAMSVAEAFAAAEAESGSLEIWIQTGTVSQPAIAINNSNSLIVRGGFAGTEAELSDRQGGELTVFDGERTSNILLSINNLSDVDVVVERIKFCRARFNGLVKSGKGGFEAYNCVTEGNGLDARKADGVKGRGMKLESDGYGSLVISNCVVAGNRNVNDDTQQEGFGLYINKFNDAIIDSCTFVTNGYNIAKPEGAYCGSYSKGAAAVVYDTPIIVRSCRFAGNCCPIRTTLSNSSGSGGTLTLLGACRGSRIENCVFIGNTECRSMGTVANINTGGALAFYLSSSLDKVLVNNCTFAYNQSHGGASAGGITVASADVEIKNSIFWKNTRYHYTTVGYGSDVQVASGSARISHSLVTALDGSALGGANLTVDEETVFVADPLFVTTTEEYESLLKVTDTTLYYDENNANRYADIAAMDAHLLSPSGYVLNNGLQGPATTETSAAIDAGDPAADYSNEPSSNGGRLNLGAYGNTAEASRTPSGQPVADVEIVFPDGLARPIAQVTMGLESGDGYMATVHILCSTGGVVIADETFFKVSNGDVLKVVPPAFMPHGVKYDVSVSITAAGAESKFYQETDEVTGTYPAYYGKGGGANVIHVRTGADGLKDGSNWEHAYSDLNSAIASLSDSAKTEIWLSVTNDYLNDVLTLDRPLAIRGGFAGVENSVLERPENLRSILHGIDFYKTLSVVVPAGLSLNVDRICFMHSVDSELKKTGAGDLVVRDCVFRDSRKDVSSIKGKGIYASGGTLSVTNCQFMNLSCPISSEPGSGIYLTSCTQAYVDDCLFVTNGPAFSYNTPNWAGHRGAAAFVDATPTIFRNCRFAACCAALYDSDKSGGIVSFAGASGGSKLINCVFVGNSDFESMKCPVSYSGGAISCVMSSQDQTLDIENCTVAYNMTLGTRSSAGITVHTGTVNLKNSIVYGNVLAKDGNIAAGADIEVKANGILNMSYTLVTGLESNYVNAVEGAVTNIGEGVIIVDPMFQSSANDFQSLFRQEATYKYLTQDVRAQCAALNVHPRTHTGYIVDGVLVRNKENVESPIIDAGDPNSDYSKEPSIANIGGNGRRVNLGAYGNTPQAAMTEILGFFIIVR